MYICSRNQLESIWISLLYINQNCKTLSVNVDDHFREVTKIVGLGSGSHRAVQDFMLTRYACYLIAQNGDPKKEEVAFAQAYQLAVVHAKSLGMDVVKRWIYKKMSGLLFVDIAFLSKVGIPISL